MVLHNIYIYIYVCICIHYVYVYVYVYVYISLHHKIRKPNNLSRMLGLTSHGFSYIYIYMIKLLEVCHGF